MKRNLLALSITTALLTGCGGGGSGATGGVTNTLSGVAVDGYLQGATVCIDMNNSGVCDSGDVTGTTTQGAFTLDLGTYTAASVAGKTIIVSGGTDMDTGANFVGTLKTVVDTSLTQQVATPLTTIIHAKVSPTISLATARSQVATSLGFTSDDLKTDPIALYNSKPEVYKKGVALQRAMEKDSGYKDRLKDDLDGSIKTNTQLASGTVTEQELDDDENNAVPIDPQNASPIVTNLPSSTTAQPNISNGRLLASNCFQCHGTNGTGGFERIAGGEAGEVRDYLNKVASSDIMAAHAHGYSDTELTALIAYFNQM
jgi:cytochrome c553